MRVTEKPLIQLGDTDLGDKRKTPLSDKAHKAMSYRLKHLGQGSMLSAPHSKPMTTVGKNCHELRLRDRGKTWRLIYRIDPAAILAVVLFEKKTQKTPTRVIERARQRLRNYDARSTGEQHGRPNTRAH